MTTKPFRRVLIANRGEIACRVIKTLHQNGLTSVAVYSEADSQAMHVHMADEAYCVGPAASQDSYLRANKILDIAKQHHIDAIHPGYGFLSENANFAKACEAAGITFIGPSPQAIRDMGEKHRAKQIADQAGVAVMPGFFGDEQDPKFLKQEADRIGYPLLIKASAGGGGKGMRIVWEADNFDSSLKEAKREAQASFADDHVILEKYLQRPRHIEIQLIADQHGNVMHLFERDCSIQRRQQKIIEEAPAPGFDADLRERMGSAACQLAKAIQYTGAGTIEFLLDQDGQFYFMEMNTRLQVEHPVTEMICGLDLVQCQLDIAQGKALPDILTRPPQPQGHAIEVRLYAEDPAREFLPCTGKITTFMKPDLDASCRLDSGVEQGDTITPYYDPMLAKLIVHGDNRAHAIAQLARALAHTHILGVTTNLVYLQQLLQLADFKQAQLHTQFIDEQQDNLLTAQQQKPLHQYVAAACLAILRPNEAVQHELWHQLGAWHNTVARYWQLPLSIDGSQETVTITHKDQGFELQFREQSYLMQASWQQQQCQLLIDDEQITLTVLNEQNQYHMFSQHGACIIDDLSLVENNQQHASDHDLTAPMPGTLIDILVKPTQQVSKGDPLLILEAMKMEYTIRAPKDGCIDKLPYQVGDLVDDGTVLVEMS